MNRSISHILIPLLLLAGSLVHAQSIDQLKQEKERLERDIALSRQRIDEMQTQRSLTLNEVVALQQQITTRQALISNIRQQITVYDGQIAESRAVINKLEDDLERLKAEYAQLLLKTYTSQNNYGTLLFLFSSGSFNDAYQRLQYLKAYSNYRQQQAALIRQTLLELDREVAAIEEKKQTQTNLLTGVQQQQQELDREKQELDTKARTLRERENYFRAQLRTKQEEADKLNRQIERMIAEAAARARSSSSTAAGGYALTPEALALSNSFSSNKGLLPWPVERGTIIQPFGRKPHPVYSGVFTDNKGVDIGTTSESEVRAIFNGKVTNTFYHPTFNRGVIISHGEYFSVYLNLKEVYVRENQEVKTKDRIGKVMGNTDGSQPMVHLELWKGTTLLNPSQWLSQ